jgi:hypothetical protein
LGKGSASLFIFTQDGPMKRMANKNSKRCHSIAFKLEKKNKFYFSF